MDTLIESTTEISVKGLVEPQIFISPAFAARREIALQNSAEIVTVNNPDEQKIAAQHRTELKALEKGLEASRELVKRPILDIGRLVDSTAKDAVYKIQLEIKRITELLNQFQIKENARVEKLRQEQEAIRLKALADAEKERAEIEAKAAKAKPAEKLELFQKQEEAEQKLVDALRDTVKAENQAVASRAAGMRVKREWKFEVTDINALYAAKPDLVKLEPNNLMIRGIIAGGCRSCPGLKIYEHIST